MKNFIEELQWRGMLHDSMPNNRRASYGKHEKCLCWF